MQRQARPPAASMEFLDREGRHWRVREVAGEAVPGARGSACLVFESDGTMRRVWRYPAEWRELPAAQLVALSWKT